MLSPRIVQVLLSQLICHKVSKEIFSTSLKTVGFSILIFAVSRPSVALVALLRFTERVSTVSATPSEVIGTVNVPEVLPAAIVKVPLVAV